MPPPEKKLEAHFIVAVLHSDKLAPAEWPVTPVARVFTLERDAEGSDSGYLAERFADGGRAHLSYNVRATAAGAFTEVCRLYQDLN